MRKKAWRAALLLIVLLTAGGLLMSFISARWLGGSETLEMRESTEQLDNPDRGFYQIHGFVLSDEMDPAAVAAKSFRGDEDGRLLALLELNLRNYTDGDISEEGLRNLGALFDALRSTGMRFIVRFLYDWNGENMQTEPTRREIIERHIRQTAPVLNANADQIYTLQGLYIGNWGEMNGTHYSSAEDQRALAKALAEATDSEILLSVRMPMQWRRLCGETPGDEAAEGLQGRLGLFNDGMLGSDSDLGTYGSAARAEADWEGMWRRSDELDFQETICRVVPNGGEVVSDGQPRNIQRDLDYLRHTHVSYLNIDYDRRVIDAWAEETVSGGVWDGIDALSYIRENLGYRFTVTDALLRYRMLPNVLGVTVSLQNVGFAPAYFGLAPQLLLLADGEERYRFPLEGDLSTLCGGIQQEPAALCTELRLNEIEPGDYTLALLLESERGVILTANEDRCASGAVIIGGIHPK